MFSMTLRGKNSTIWLRWDADSLKNLFAGIALGLNGLLTALIVPPLVRWLW